MVTRAPPIFRIVDQRPCISIETPYRKSPVEMKDSDYISVVPLFPNCPGMSYRNRPLPNVSSYSPVPSSLSQYPIDLYRSENNTRGHSLSPVPILARRSSERLSSATTRSEALTTRLPETACHIGRSRGYVRCRLQQLMIQPVR